ncbi:MAG: Gldg family protein [Gemmataceae bacterium]
MNKPTSNASAPAQPASTISPFFRTLLKNRSSLRAGIFVVGALFLAGPVVGLARSGLGSGIRLTWIYAAIMGLISFLVGTFDLVGDEETEEGQVSRLRLELMALGGLLGLGTAILGFTLPFTTYREQLAAGLESWRANPGALIWPGLAIVGGLGLMFFSLLLVRGLERQSQSIRRLVYGFNVVLSTLLLLAVLVLPNVLAYAEPFTRFFGRPFDWTATDINTISPLMRNYLAGLKEPVKVYVMLPRNSPITMDTQTLLENCRSLNSKFSWELVSPTSPENITRIEGLMSRYGISDPSGLLVIVGQESDKSKPDFQFIKGRDLYQQDDDPMGRRRNAGLSYAYSGENALYNALSSMTEGKAVIYFASGHGELTPDVAPPEMMPTKPRARSGGLTKLRERLTERKSIEVKTLEFDRNLKRIPDDASLLVIARPTQPFDPAEVKVLREYLHRQARTEKVKEASGEEREIEKVAAGKMILLASPIIQKEGSGARMALTGLEGLLAEYNVKLGNDRILTVVQAPTPLEIRAIPDPQSANPVAKAFSPSPTTAMLFPFQVVRSVEPGEGKGGLANVDRLMVSLPRFGIIQDTRLDIDPVEYVAALRADEDRLEKALAQKPVTVAVAVSEGGAPPPGMPRDKDHSSQLKETPRMVVFGSSHWITDEGLQGGLGTLRQDLFQSCMSWLREKSSIGQKIEAKKRKEYEPNIAPQDAGKVMFLPLGLLLLGVIGLGTGVWVVRRR